MNRRQFTFWLGFGLFSVADRLRVYALDDIAAAAMRATEATLSTAGDPTATTKVPIHWTAAENKNWRWFEREDFIEGQWKLTGITTPVHKQTKKLNEGPGYLHESVVPKQVRLGKKTELTELPPEVSAEYAKRQPKEKLRARHGRPPSKWLRSLHAEELRIWLRTIDVPEAGVSGMTYWEHLTRDHSFDPKKIEGLDEDEQAKLHAAAHFGY
jgi:hypothetical protein